MKLSTGKRHISAHKIFFIAIAAICIGYPILSYAGPSHSIHPLHEKVTVQPGETVWKIVIREYPDLTNVWDGIDAIKQENGISDFSKVKAGFTLNLPIVQ